MLPLLTEVKNGSRKNWRHDVYVGKHVLIDGSRVMKHHLVQYAVDTADFTTGVVDAIMGCLSEFNPGMYIYNQSVLTPTVLLWIVIALAELNAAQANFYLSNGGKHNQEKAYNEMERKACKYIFILKFAICIKMVHPLLVWTNFRGRVGNSKFSAAKKI